MRRVIKREDRGITTYEAIFNGEIVARVDVMPTGVVNRWVSGDDDLAKHGRQALAVILKRLGEPAFAGVVN